MAKDLASPYVSGRSRAVAQGQGPARGGIRRRRIHAPGGAARGVRGAPAPRVRGARHLRFVGKVGSGFGVRISPGSRGFSRRQRRARVRRSSPPPRHPGVTWIAPQYVAQIEFQEWTHDRKLRQPVFLGLRDDKEAVRVRAARRPVMAAALRRPQPS